MQEPMSAFSARAFLSHSSKDARAARQLKSQLDRRGVAIWAYETDLPFGSLLEEEIKKRIRDSDYLLVLLSDAVCTSEWVAREIGLARQLQSRSGTSRPLILGIRRSLHCQFPTLEILDFDTGGRTGTFYDFSRSRCFTLGLTSEGLDDFAKFLRPTVTFISSASERHTSLLRASFNCYEELFPDPAERDDPESIEDWLEEARNAERIGSPWREIYGVLSVAGYVIGFAFLSAHTHRRWCFGNYFGVRRGWRERDRARVFLSKVSDYLRGMIPGIGGMLFEVEPVNCVLLEEGQAQRSLAAFSQQTELLENLRAYLRIRFYQGYHSVSVLQADGSPLPYWQPALHEPLDESGEKAMLLMAQSLSPAPLGPFEIGEVLGFIYDDLYGDAYGSVGPAELPGYAQYAKRVKSRVEHHVRRGGCRLGPLVFPRTISGLRQRARDEGLMDELAL